MATRVGFIGLGNIGKPMAVNVAKGDFDLMVYDVRPEPIKELVALGAKAATSPLDIGKHADIVELVVMNDAQVEEITMGPKGVFNTMARGSVVAIHSTVHPNTVKKVFEAGRARGIDVFDAQVSGGEKGAAAKTLAYMVPALLSGGKVIISTGTKTLQDQLFHRDLPMVRDALAVPVVIALLKGRANYVCHYLRASGTNSALQLTTTALLPSHSLARNSILLHPHLFPRNPSPSKSSNRLRNQAKPESTYV